MMDVQIPGPIRPFFQLAGGLLFNVGDTKIDYDSPNRAPLLFIAGGDDIVPPKVNYKNAKRYKGKGTITEVKEFPGRSHYGIVGEPGWEEVADYALSWATRFTS
jgi:non-heme chloroperoxidase